MTRVKPVNIIPSLESLDDVDATLARIAGFKRHIALVEASMNEEMDAIKLRAARECEPVRQDIAALEQAVLRYAEAHKADLFTSRKSLALTFGVIGYRASTKLKTLTKWTWERVLQTLRDRDMRGFIRVKEEVDKEALKGLAPDDLATLGVKAVAEDVFFYELEEQEVAAGVNMQAGNAA